jgi:hypothetical protein
VLAFERAFIPLDLFLSAVLIGTVYVAAVLLAGRLPSRPLKATAAILIAAYAAVLLVRDFLSIRSR